MSAIGTLEREDLTAAFGASRTPRGEASRVEENSAFVAISSLALLAACATIVEGDSQAIDVSSNPNGALCELTRGGERIGVVNRTPGSVFVETSKHDIIVGCEKEGFQDGRGVLTSGFEAMTLGNLIFGGIVGVAVDAGSGAMNDYPSSIVVTLPPVE